MDALDADFFKTTKTRMENIGAHFADLLSNAPEKVKQEIGSSFDFIADALEKCQDGVATSLSSLATQIDNTLQKIDNFLDTTSLPMQRDVLYANMKQASKEADRLRNFETKNTSQGFTFPDFVHGV